MIAERAVDFGEIGTENDLVNFVSVHSTNPYSADGWTMHNKPGGVYLVTIIATEISFWRWKAEGTPTTF